MMKIFLTLLVVASAATELEFSDSASDVCKMTKVGGSLTSSCAVSVGGDVRSSDIALDVRGKVRIGNSIQNLFAANLPSSADIIRTTPDGRCCGKKYGDGCTDVTSCGYATGHYHMKTNMKCTDKNHPMYHLEIRGHLFTAKKAFFCEAVGYLYAARGHTHNSASCQSGGIYQDMKLNSYCTETGYLAFRITDDQNGSNHWHASDLQVNYVGGGGGYIASGTLLRITETAISTADKEWCTGGWCALCPKNKITINAGAALPKGYTVRATGFSGNTKVYNTKGGKCEEIDAHYEKNTLYFATQDSISTGTNTDYTYETGKKGKSDTSKIFLLFDDFSKVNGNWKHGDKFPDSDGHYEITGGVMKMSVNGGRGDGHPGDPIAYYNDYGAFEWRDYELQVDWKDLAHTSRDYPGPLLRLKDQRVATFTSLWFEYYIGQNGNSICCLRASHKRSDAGWRHTYNHNMHVGLSAHEWHQTNIKLVGDYFTHKFTNGGRTYVANNHEYMDSSTERAADKGTIGFTSHTGYGGTKIHWDNVKVMKAVHPDPTASA
jgi:hypothetical protein